MSSALYFVSPLILALVVDAGELQKRGAEPYHSSVEDRVVGNVIQRGGRPYGHLIGRDHRQVVPFDAFRQTNLSAFVEPASGSLSGGVPADRPTSYAISLNGGSGQRPAEVSRKVKILESGYTAPNTYRSVTRHTIYMKLPRPVTAGQTVEVKFGPDLSSSIEVKFDPFQLESDAIHVSRVGYAHGSGPKFGYYSAWMGKPGLTSANGRREAAFKPAEPPEFLILAHPSNRIVHSGVMSQNVSMLKRDLDQTLVFRADFSAVEEPGAYKMVIKNVGVSKVFSISQHHWSELFKHGMKGFYHQRSGVALDMPYTTWKRPRSLHPADGFIANQSGATLMDTDQGLNLRGASSFQALGAAASTTPVPEAWGGWHDAGDWDRRIQHLDAVRALLTLSSLRPSLIESTLLSIPRGDKGVPDTILEALWGLDVFRRLQQADGGIRGGIEGTRYPLYGEASWTDPQQLYVYAADPWSSYSYAATAALAASVVSKYDDQLAKTYGMSAELAFRWAERQVLSARDKDALLTARNLAAASLYLMTGRGEYAEVFFATSRFVSGQPAAAREQHEAGFIFLRAKAKEGDAEHRNAITAGILWFAELYRREGRGTYDQILDPWRPYGWGNVSNIPEAAAEVLIPAHYLTGAKVYLEALAASTFFGLGANPDNIVYTTGLDQNSPREVLHIDRIALAPRSPPPGLTILGTRDVSASESFWWQRLVNDQLRFLRLDELPVHETHQGFFLAPELTEYTIRNGLREPALVWGYLAGQADDP